MDRFKIVYLRFILALWAINHTSYRKHMNMLNDGPSTLVIEPESSTLPLWYSGGEFPVLLSFNSIKQLIETSNDILTAEIENAKLTRDEDNIGKANTLILNVTYHIFSAQVALKVVDRTIQIRQLLRDALRKLKLENKHCDRDTCVCNGFYTHCTFRRNARRSRNINNTNNSTNN